MKLIIAGDRTIEDYNLLCTIMSVIPPNWEPITEVVSGKARGVDTLGERWAEERGIPVKSFPADWDKHKKAAGPIRNRQMGDYADCAVVLYKDSSRGSKNMIEYMEKLGKPCFTARVCDDLDA